MVILASATTVLATAMAELSPDTPDASDKKPNRNFPAFQALSGSVRQLFLYDWLKQGRYNLQIEETDGVNAVLANHDI